MSTKDPAARVQRFRDYRSVRYTSDTDGQREAYEAGINACTENMLASIEQDPASPEGLAWATMAEVISYRFRRSF